MKRKLNKIILMMMLSIFLFYPLFGTEYDDPIIVISPVMSAVGGPHTTMNDGFSSLLNNPAGFGSAEPQLSIAEITFGLKGPVFDMANLIVNNDLSNIPSLLQGIYTGVDLLGPVSFGYIGNGLGLGIYGNTISTVSSIDPLTVKVKLGEEVVICGGYSFSVPFGTRGDHALDFGMLLKGSFKGIVEFNKSALNILDISISSVTEEPFDFITGIGFDLGLRYEYKNIFSAGVVGRDIFSPTLHTLYSSLSSFSSGNTSIDTSYGIVPFALDLGVMYSPDFSKTNSFISSLKFYLDYYDTLDFWLYPAFATNPILHVGLGTEVTVLEILSLRAGLYQGLFSAGLGLDLYYFTLDAAMFGTELSTEPGLHPVYNVQLGISFRI